MTALLGGIIGFNRPASPSWNIVGTGASFDTDAARLSNGIVSDLTAIVWLSGSQTTSSVLKLQSTWPIPQVVRLITFIGLKDIPAGTKIVVTGKRQSDSDFTYALGGNSATQRTVLLPDGSVGAWIICAAGLDPIIGYQIAVYNDVNGSTSFVASQFIYVGESDALAGLDVKIKDGGVAADYDGLPPEDRSVNKQPRILPSRPYRTNDTVTIPVTQATAIGTSTSTFTSYEQLMAITVMGDSVALITSWQDQSGNLDAWKLHQVAVFGVPRKLGRPQSIGNGYYVAKFGIAESAPGN